jgi:hypothetical protein
VVSSIGPDYTATVQTSPIIIPIGDIVHIKVKTSNIGNAPGGATSFTSTVITPADCSPPTSRGILPLNPGDTNTLPFDCPCTTPGVHNIVSEADSTRVIADPDRTNNIGTATYYCAGSQVFACSDYV